MPPAGLRNYKVVDVFTSRPLFGNPVAVVLDGDGLESEQMQAVARWTNLSETTFVLPPTQPNADYRLRIFTPRKELPFAGHPTLGSAHALVESGRVRPGSEPLRQECGVGIVEIFVAGIGVEQQFTLALPDAKVTHFHAEDVPELETALGGPISLEAVPAIIDVGAIWVVAQMDSAFAVLMLKPDFPRLAALEQRLGVTGVTVFGRHSLGKEAIEVRSFAPSAGVDEDPVCGSGNGSVAVFLHERGLLGPGNPSYVARQGYCVGRRGRVAVAVNAEGRITVGGHCVTCVDGRIIL